MALLRNIFSRRQDTYCGFLHVQPPCRTVFRPPRPLLPFSCRASLCTSPEPPYSTEEVIASMKKHYVLDEHAPPQAQEVEVRGSGTHLGVACRWNLRFRADGAFYEEVTSTYLTFKWHYNGMPGGRCVEVDNTGLPKLLELDDHEMMVMGMLLRTGLWMRDEVVNRLGVERWVVPLPAHSSRHVPAENIFSDAEVYPSVEGPPALYKLAMGEAGSSGSSSAATLRSSHGHMLIQRSGAAPTSSGSSSSRREAVVAANATATPQEAAVSSSSSSGSGVAQRGKASTSSSSSRKKGKRGTGTGSGEGDSFGAVADNLVGVCLKFKNGKLVMRLRVDTNTWLPTSYTQSLCGAGELWRFKNWGSWNLGQHHTTSPGYNSVVWPQFMTHNVANGGDYEYKAEVVDRPSNPYKLIYQGPYLLPPNMMPADAIYNKDKGAEVLSFRTPMGHLLIPVSINNQPSGWMILDSGASGFVVDTSRQADTLEVEGAGTQVAGVMGKTTTSFRRAKLVTMGPLTLVEQNVMCMDISNIVKDFHEPVKGIAGHEIFRRTVVEIPSRQERLDAVKQSAKSGVDVPHAAALMEASSSRSGRSSPTGKRGRPRSRSSRRQGTEGVLLVPPEVELAPAAASGRSAASEAGVMGAAAADALTDYHCCPLYLKFHHPSYSPMDSRLKWLPMHMISCLPHLPVTFQIPDGRVVSALFMVDTGAGGVDLLFHARAANELGLPTSGPGVRTRSIRGVGELGSSRSTTVELDLPWMQFGSTAEGGWAEAQAGQQGVTRFKKVRSLFPKEGGLDISLYSAGIICAGLLDRMHVVLDYSRQRFGYYPDMGADMEVL